MNNLVLKKYQPILKTTLLAYVITVISLLILSFLVYKFNLSENGANIGINIVYIISCFISGFVLGHIKQEKKYLWGLFNGISYFLFLIIISLIVQPSITASFENIVFIAVMCTLSSSLGGMIS